MLTAFPLSTPCQNQFRTGSSTRIPLLTSSYSYCWVGGPDFNFPLLARAWELSLASSLDTITSVTTFPFSDPGTLLLECNLLLYPHVPVGKPLLFTCQSLVSDYTCGIFYSLYIISRILNLSEAESTEAISRARERPFGASPLAGRWEMAPAAAPLAHRRGARRTATLSVVGIC